MKINQILLAVLALLFLASCGAKVSDKDQMANFIPKDAALIARFDVATLMEKTDFEEVKKMAFYQDMLKEIGGENEALAFVLENPTASGIDLEKSVFVSFFMREKTKAVGGFYFPLQDRTKFEELLTAANIDFDKKEVDGNMVYTKEDGVIVVGEHHAILITDGVESYQSFIANTKNAIVQNGDFRSFLKGKGDVAYWLTSTPFLDMIGQEKVTETLKMFKEKDFKNNYAYAYISFEKGAVVADGETHLTKGLKSDLSLIFGKGIHYDFSKSFPGEHLKGIYVATVSPRGTYQLSKEYLMSGMVDSKVEDNFGMKIEELILAFTGEVAVGFYSDEKQINDGKKSNMVVALKIGKEKVFNQLMTRLVEKKVLTQNGEEYRFFDGDSADDNQSLVRKGDVLYAFLNTAPALKDKILTGDFKHSSDIQKKIKKMSKRKIAGFVFYPAFLKTIDTDMADFFNEIVSVEGIYDLSGGYGKIEFKDDSVNSLQLFFKALNEAYLKKEKHIDLDVPEIEVEAALEM